MLTQVQSNETARFNKMNLLFVKQAGIVDTYAPFATIVAAFTTDLATLNALIPNKNADATGVTAGKTIDKIHIATKLSKVCNIVRAFAIATGNTTLLAQMQASKTSIIRMKDADIMGYVTTIVSLVTPLLTLTLFNPYGITAATLAPITDLSITYNGLIGKASVDESGNAIANDKIDTTITKLQTHKDNLDLLLSGYEPDNTDFIASYKTNSAAIYIGILHSGIKGGITDSVTGEGIGKVVITLVATDKTGTSDLLGQYAITVVPPGLYTVTTSAEGYVTQSKVIRIVRGKITPLDFVLVKSN